MTNLTTSVAPAAILAAVGADVVGVLVRRSELAVATATDGATTPRTVFALALRTVAEAVRQPAYETTDAGIPKRTETILTGLDALRNLHDNFGSKPDGLRRVYLDQEVLARLSGRDDVADAIDAIAAVDAGRDAGSARSFAARAPEKAAPTSSTVTPTAPGEPRRVAVLVTVTDVSAALRLMLDGSNAGTAPAYAACIAELVDAVDQPAFAVAGDDIAPLGQRVSGVAGLMNLYDTFYGARSVPGGLRRLWLDADALDTMATDPGLKRLVEFVRAMSAQRAAIGAEATRIRRSAGTHVTAVA